MLEVPTLGRASESSVKIINRYVLKEHVGPFVFALSALTSLLLLQYIARQFGDLVGRGLSWQVITEFFLLSIPFTVAMTLPMAVLVRCCTRSAGWPRKTRSRRSRPAACRRGR